MAFVAKRFIIFRKRDDEGYGFSVRGDAPVVIAGVEPASLAYVSIKSSILLKGEVIDFEVDPKLYHRFSNLYIG